MYQFNWLQHRYFNTIFVQILYIDKPLGSVDEYSSVDDIRDKLCMEHSDEQHTRPRMLVSYWLDHPEDNTFTFWYGGWLPTAGMTTDPDFPWQDYDIGTIANSPEYTIQCADKASDEPILWNDAMTKIKTYIKNDQIKALHFHPRQIIDKRCYHLAKKCNIMVFLLHLDGIVMLHQLTRDKEFITVGFLLLNLIENTKTSYYYFRIALIRKNDAWTFPVMFKLIDKEINSWKKGFPLPDPDERGKFVMVYPIFLGILADGKEICQMLNKQELSAYAGALFLKECIRLNPDCIGTENSPCFISRRFLTNSVSSITTI